MHKKWEFGPVLNTPLTSHRRNEQHKLPSGFWCLFIPSVCYRQTTKPSYLCPSSGSEVDLPAPILSSALMSDAEFLPPPPRSTATTSCPSPAPLHGLQPWKHSLAASEAKQALHPHAPSLNWFAVLSHPSKIKKCKLLLLSLALLTLCSFLFGFDPFTLVLCIWHRTCQKGCKWEKALDRRWMKTVKVNFFYRKAKFPTQDSSSFQILFFNWSLSKKTDTTQKAFA